MFMRRLAIKTMPPESPSPTVAFLRNTVDEDEEAQKAGTGVLSPVWDTERHAGPFPGSLWAALEQEEPDC